MSFLVLTRDDVQRLLTMKACIEVMADALTALAQGEYQQPLRSIFRPSAAAGLMAWMPVHRTGASAVFGTKVLCVIPENSRRGLDGHQGAILLQDGVTGELRAVLDATAITAIRTAAVSALATRLLARSDARELTIIGSGTQAERHLEAILLVRPITRVTVASRSFAGAQRLVERMRSRVPCDLVALESIELAVRRADVVVTATTSSLPVLQRSWLASGVHLNAIGASQPDAREIDTATWAAARVVVDRLESVQQEAGDYRLALAEGALLERPAPVELGDVLLGHAEGRRSDSEITLFRSLGLAVEDTAAAQYVLRCAEALEVGTRVDF